MSVPLSNGSIRITWQSPTNSNGRILGYEVTYGPIGGVERALSASSESITLNELRELLCSANMVARIYLLSNLQIYILPCIHTFILAESEVPYRVAVRARTSKGSGKRAALVVFSREGGIYCTILFNTYKIALTDLLYIYWVQCTNSCIPHYIH